jgi:hypothetical protein
MADIIGNDMGFNHKPSMPEFLNVGRSPLGVIFWSARLTHRS